MLMLVYRSHIGWNLNVKSKLSVCTAKMLNTHSNPYIEITTVLSDNSIVSIKKHIIPYRIIYQ